MGQEISGQEIAFSNKHAYSLLRSKRFMSTLKEACHKTDLEGHETYFEAYHNPKGGFDLSDMVEFMPNDFEDPDDPIMYDGEMVRKSILPFVLDFHCHLHTLPPNCPSYPDLMNLKSAYVGHLQMIGQIFTDKNIEALLIQMKAPLDKLEVEILALDLERDFFITQCPPGKPTQGVVDRLNLGGYNCTLLRYEYVDGFYTPKFTQKDLKPFAHKIPALTYDEESLEAYLERVKNGYDPLADD